MYISRDNYCQVYLDQWQDSLKVDNWFEFLDRPDRFYQLIRRAEPPTVKNICDELLIDSALRKHPKTDLELERRRPLTIHWSDVNELIGGWYGLWPNPTPKEKDANTRIDELNIKWSYEFCGFIQYESDVALSVIQEYEAIDKEFAV